MQIEEEIRERTSGKYEGLSDEELVKMIVNQPHNEEAALYLIYVKYRPLFRGLCKEYVKDMGWLDYCLSDVFVSLKSSKGDWHPLAGFGWTCTLGAYLKGVADNNFKRIKRRIDGREISIEDDETNKTPVHVAGGDGTELERRMELVMVLEAIQTLPSDQKFVVLKDLEGHSGKEIAAMLQKKWEREGIKKYARSGENKGLLVVPSEAYVNNLKSRALEALRRMFGEDGKHERPLP